MSESVHRDLRVQVLTKGLRGAERSDSVNSEADTQCDELAPPDATRLSSIGEDRTVGLPPMDDEDFALTPPKFSFACAAPSQSPKTDIFISDPKAMRAAFLGKKGLSPLAHPAEERKSLPRGGYSPGGSYRRGIDGKPPNLQRRASYSVGPTYGAPATTAGRRPGPSTPSQSRPPIPSSPLPPPARMVRRNSLPVHMMRGMGLDD